MKLMRAFDRRFRWATHVPRRQKEISSWRQKEIPHSGWWERRRLEKREKFIDMWGCFHPTTPENIYHVHRSTIWIRCWNNVHHFIVEIKKPFCTYLETLCLDLKCATKSHLKSPKCLLIYIDIVKLAIRQQRRRKAANINFELYLRNHKTSSQIKSESLGSSNNRAFVRVWNSFQGRLLFHRVIKWVNKRLDMYLINSSWKFRKIPSSVKHFKSFRSFPTQYLESSSLYQCRTKKIATMSLNSTFDGLEIVKESFTC